MSNDLREDRGMVRKRETMIADGNREKEISNKFVIFRIPEERVQ